MTKISGIILQVVFAKAFDSELNILEAALKKICCRKFHRKEVNIVFSLIGQLLHNVR